VLVRKLPKELVEDFARFVEYQNSFVWLDFFAVPSEVRELQDFYYVTYFGVLGEKISPEKLSSLQRAKLLSRILELAWAIKVGIVPPVYYFSFDDVFEYAGDFTFVPPLLPSFESAKISEKQVTRVAADELGMQNGVEASLEVLEDVVKALDSDGLYVDLFRSLKGGEVTKYLSAIFPQLGSTDDNKSLGRLLEHVNRIINELTNIRGFEVLQLDGMSITFFDLFSKLLACTLHRDWTVVPVKNDFVNVLRHLVRISRTLGVSVEDSLFRCLYENCRFDTIASELVRLVKTLGKSIIFVIDNYKDADVFVEEFFKLLQKMVRGSEQTFVVMTLRAKSSVVRRFEIQPSLKAHFKISSPDGFDLVKLTTLGSKFRLKELQIYCQTFGLEQEKLLEKAYDSLLLTRRNLDFEFENTVYEELYESLDIDVKKQLHATIAQKLATLDDSYILGTLKSGMHWERAGCPGKAVVMYLRFVRSRLDDYASSPTRITLALERAYELLKGMGRLNSYAFQFLLLKYAYQTAHIILEDVLKTMEVLDPFLKVLRDFVLENYDACLLDSVPIGLEKVSSFKGAWILFLKNYAYFRKYDKLHDEKRLLEVAKKLTGKNRKSFELKAEIFHLLGTSVAYYDRKRAKSYLDLAEELATTFEISHIRIKVANSYSMVYDSELVSLVFLRKAIELANRTGYYYRTFDSRINLLRALLFFGRIKEFIEEFNRLKEIIESDDTVDSGIVAYFWRIAGFLGTYLLNRAQAREYYERALRIEEITGLQRASLRGLVLLEVMYGNFEEAKRIVFEHREDPALKTRAFEYLTKLVLAESDEEFLRAWREYMASEVYLLREEILYAFAKRIAVLDEEGFLEEVARWESTYTVERTKLSLFYVLLAKEKYYELKGNTVRRELTYRQLLRLAKSMGITHPEVPTPESEEGESHPLLFVLEVFRSINPKAGLEKIVQLFSNIIYEVFQASKIHVEVFDRKSGVHEFFTTTGGLDDERTEIRLHPFSVTIADNIDEDCRYVIHFCSPVVDYEKLEEAENVVWLLEEIFSEQVRAVVYRERSSLDSLTGLYNRWKFLEVLGEFYRRYVEKARIFSIFILDIDDFKRINDTMGHAKGDEVLCWLARKLKKFTDGKGFVGRFGGEEFVGILEMDKLSASAMCTDFKLAVEKESQIEIGINVTVSVGVAEVTERQTLTELIGLADQRLYVAKNSGKNSVCANSLV